ncbi:UNVERIFIED_CONTAM: hypothetical protein Sindi_0998200 [Sesamum indicum]
MPEYFEFKEDDISLMSIWATLPSLSLECWHPNAFGKIGSRFGTPIAMDSLTMKMERVSYARILVEVDASKKLIEQVEFVLPNNVTQKQPIVYEFTPKFCTVCNSRQAKKTKPAEWTVVQRRNKGKTNNAVKPTIEVQRPTSPLVGKVEKGQPATKTLQPLKLKENEVLSPADSASSSTDLNFLTCTQYAMSGTKIAEIATKAHLIKNSAALPLGHFGGEACSINNSEDSPLISGWCQTNNFDTIAGGRILVVWNPAVIDLHPEDISPQVIHCRSTNKSSQLSFCILFTYGLYSFVNRRSMWEKLFDLGQTLSMSWLIMGYFNCVKSSEKNSLEWPQLAKATPCGASLIGSPTTMNGSRLVCIAAPISIQQDASPTTLQLESDPGDVALRDSLGDIRNKVVFLADAERHFYYQKAKIHYLKEGDHNTKFFHDMVKRNITRNSTMVVTRADGTIITVAEDIAQEFIDYYTSLMGTEDHTLPVDDGVFEWCPKLFSEHTMDFCRALTPLEVKEAIFYISDNKVPGLDDIPHAFSKKHGTLWVIKSAGPSWISLGVGGCYDSSTILSLPLCPNQIIPPLLQITSRFLVATSSTKPSRKSSRTGSRPHWST